MARIHWPCKCGHTKSEHTGMSGPNSIGQWFHGECVHGSKVVAIYRVGGCRCGQFQRVFLPQVTREDQGR